MLVDQKPQANFGIGDHDRQRRDVTRLYAFSRKSGPHFGTISLLSYTEKLEKKKGKSTRESSNIPMGTVRLNCTFLSERVLCHNSELGEFTRQRFHGDVLVTQNIRFCSRWSTMRATATLGLQDQPSRPPWTLEQPVERALLYNFGRCIASCSLHSLARPGTMDDDEKQPLASQQNLERPRTCPVTGLRVHLPDSVSNGGCNIFLPSLCFFMFVCAFLPAI